MTGHILLAMHGTHDLLRRARVRHPRHRPPQAEHQRDRRPALRARRTRAATPASRSSTWGSTSAPSSRRSCAGGSRRARRGSTSSSRGASIRATPGTGASAPRRSACSSASCSTSLTGRRLGTAGMQPAPVERRRATPRSASGRSRSASPDLPWSSRRLAVLGKTHPELMTKGNINTAYTVLLFARRRPVLLAAVPGSEAGRRRAEPADRDLGPVRRRRDLLGRLRAGRLDADDLRRRVDPQRGLRARLPIVLVAVPERRPASWRLRPFFSLALDSARATRTLRIRRSSASASCSSASASSCSSAGRTSGPASGATTSRRTRPRSSRRPEVRGRRPDEHRRDPGRRRRRDLRDRAERRSKTASGRTSRRRTGARSSAMAAKYKVTLAGGRDLGRRRERRHQRPRKTRSRTRSFRKWERVSWIWLFLVYLLHTIGELCLSPVGLAAMTRLAPARVVGLMMGVWFLAISVGNFLGGSVAGYYDKFELPTLLTLVAGERVRDGADHVRAGHADPEDDGRRGGGGRAARCRQATDLYAAHVATRRKKAEAALAAAGFDALAAPRRRAVHVLRRRPGRAVPPDAALRALGAARRARTTCCSCGPGRSRCSCASRPRTTGTSRRRSAIRSGPASSSWSRSARRGRGLEEAAAARPHRLRRRRARASARDARHRGAATLNPAALVARLDWDRSFKTAVRGRLPRGGDEARGARPPRRAAGVRGRRLRARDPPDATSRRSAASTTSCRTRSIVALDEKGATLHYAGKRDAPERQGAPDRRGRVAPRLRLRHHAHVDDGGGRSGLPRARRSASTRSSATCARA